MIDRETCKFIKLACENGDQQDFQNFIRKGLKHEINEFLKGQNLSVLKSKFFIDMRLNERQHDKDVQREDLRASGRKYKSLENGAIEMDETDGFEEMVSKRTESEGFNTRMTVNALHLAIFSRQFESVKCLLDHIFEGERENGQDYTDAINEVVGDKVALQHYVFQASDFSYYDRCMNGMNALHLSCHYYPQAVELIFDTVFKNLNACPNMRDIVNEKNNILQFSPLHIAAKNSLVTAAR